jgi:hypothetical protein
MILAWMGFAPLNDFELIVNESGARLVWYVSAPQPTEAEIDAAALGAYKAAAIAANRAEARSRIEARWPDTIQRSAALGVYPQAVVDEMRADIASVVAAENAAADAIDACTTVEQVLAVTVNWPVI